ncbi:MAG: glycosyltransferase [Vulcanimicrobiaceae bacterium]
MRQAKPRIAIVSDPLVQRGGAERVVETIAGIFPDAPIYTILYSAQTGPASIEDRVISSPLGRIPGAAAKHRWFLPFYAAAVESFDLSQYDIIISSHHTAAKGVLRHAGQRHICYCHTPMRALWERPHEELRTIPAPLRGIAGASMRSLRRWDLASASRVDQFIANSEVTRTRISKHYGRFSAVLHPPIDVERFTPGLTPAQDYYLVASRNVPYKRIDIAVEAAARANRNLVIVGCSPDAKELRGPHVRHYGHVSDAQLLKLMQGARALLFPGYEDFGMAPVEMMACGRPVIAYGKGGALETVVDAVTGLLVDEQSPQAFADAICRFETMRFDPQVIRRHAEGFSKQRFVSAFREIVESDSGTRASIVTDLIAGALG